MIKNYLHIKKSGKKGRGVFTKENIKAKIVVEVSPVIVMSAKDRAIIDKTKLHDYIFAWGKSESQCCLALGMVSFYNHSYSSNCEYCMDFEKATIQVKTVKEIKAGEELTINYNGNWNNKKEIWFEVS
jgi:SET domain-containing protein